jgi:hypothetical protein
MALSHWQPDQKAVENEYHNLKRHYGSRRIIGKIPENFESAVREFAKISVFLQDTNAILMQLKKLNASLVVESEKRGVLIKELDPNSYLKHNKLLRNLLEQELTTIGFQPDLGKATGLLPPDVFRSLIREGFLIKDPGAGVDHGEFTHAMQWLLIGWQQNESQFLNKPVIEIFKQLGDERSVFKKSAYGQSTIWDVLVDQVIDYCKDCRSPEYLHKLILSNNDPDLLLLKKLCESRVKKRQTNNTSSFSDIFSQKKTYTKKEYDISDKDNNLFIARKKVG